MIGFNYDTRMSLAQRMVDRGDAFRTFREFAIPANGEKSFSILNGANAIGFFSRLIVTSLPNVRYEVRTGSAIATYTSQPIKIFNLNPMINKPSANTFRECTYSVLGDLGDVDLIPGQAASGNNAAGDIYSNPDDLKINLPNIEYHLRFLNPNNNPANVLFYLKWFEFPANIWNER